TLATSKDPKRPTTASKCIIVASPDPPALCVLSLAFLSSLQGVPCTEFIVAIITSCLQTHVNLDACANRGRSGPWEEHPNLFTGCTERYRPFVSSAWHRHYYMLALLVRQQTNLEGDCQPLGDLQSLQA
ncbi:hypothetical protein Taro_008767, partial [Colocasia esculenta]|nr:hypothetical protein [Colocasia esculenta]